MQKISLPPESWPAADGQGFRRVVGSPLLETIFEFLQHDNKMAVLNLQIHMVAIMDPNSHQNSPATFV